MAPRAAARLELLGFTDVSHYKAGKLDWMAAGLPTEGENAARPRAGTVARKDVPVFSATDRVGDGRDRARAARWDAAVAVDPNRVGLRLPRAGELANGPGLLIHQAVRPAPRTLRPHVAI